MPRSATHEFEDDSELSNRGFSPEVELLLNCCRNEVGAEIRFPSDGSIFGGVPDWKYFFELTKHHRLVPLVHEALKRQREQVPTWLLDDLRRAHEQVGRHNIELAGELVALVRLLERSGIPVLALKGPVLATTLHRGLGNRHCGDLDILVPPERVKEAKDLIVERGYRVDPPDLHGVREDYYLRTCKDYQLIREARPLLVELHWSIDVPSRAPAASFDRRVSVPLAGAEVPALPPEELLVFLCRHGCKHAWRRLFWLVDVAALLHTHRSLDWQRVRSLAEERQELIELLTGLDLARRLLGVRLPTEIEGELRTEPKVPELTARAIYNLRLPERDELDYVLRAQRFQWAMTSGFKEKARYLGDFLLRPNAGDFCSNFPTALVRLRRILGGLRFLARHALRSLRSAVTNSAG